MRAPGTPFRRSAPLFLLCASAAFAAPGIVPIQAPAGNTLTPSETLAQSKDFINKMQDSVRRIAQLQELARKQKDIIKLNCTNDKMLQVKGHLAVGDQAMTSLQEAMAKTDDDARQHEYTRVTILYQKVLVLATEAENCIGEDLSYIGSTNVTLDIDPSIPIADVTAFAVPTSAVERPPAASSPM